jgi:hypothetical protein
VGVSLRSPEEMAAVFKKNKAEIEAYFAKQDLAAIIPELRLEDLISNAEELEINSTELSKRAHTLTTILESKIVNNPGLFQNLKQFLGSLLKDFSESPQPAEISTTMVPSSSGESGAGQEIPTHLESSQTTVIPGQTRLTPATITWAQQRQPVIGPSLSFQALDLATPITPCPAHSKPAGHDYATQSIQVQRKKRHRLHQADSPLSIHLADTSPTTPITPGYPVSYSKAGFYASQQQYSLQEKIGLERGQHKRDYHVQSSYHQYSASSGTSTSAGLLTSRQRTTQLVEPVAKKRILRQLTMREKLSGASSVGATGTYTPVSETKSPIVPTIRTQKQPSQRMAFPGIEFSSYRKHVMVGHKGRTIRGEGVQLRIPPKAIEIGTYLDMSLQGCISGPFCLPEGIQLASPVFLVKCTPQYQFQKELTLTIHHFVLLQNREQCKDMVLLTSPEMKVEDKDYIYWKLDHFHDQPLAQCSPYASYGEVELTHFSFLCFGIRLRRGKLRGLSVYL